MTAATAIPPRFAETRDALRRVACYVMAPARKARTGRIGLRPVAGGFGTPPFEDGSALVVRENRLGWQPGREISLTTLRAAAVFVGVELSGDPGVGQDLPSLCPDEALDVDPMASRALGAWFAMGGAVLAALKDDLPKTSISSGQIWPEHFDLGAVAELTDRTKVNLGFSPGDSYHDGPYVYVGPQDTSILDGPFWNAPFGATLSYDELRTTDQAEKTALQFLLAGIDAAGRSRPAPGLL